MVPRFGRICGHFSVSRQRRIRPQPNCQRREFTSRSYDFSSLEYWEKFYQRKQNNFEWFFSISDSEKSSVFDPVEAHLANSSQADKLLHVGCGTSDIRFLKALFPGRIYHIDYCAEAIEICSKLNGNESNTDVFLVADVTSLDFDDEEFTIVFDKGTLCALDSANDPSKVNRMLTQVYRCLKPNGCYISISDSPPEKRLPFLQSNEYDWRVTFKEFNDDYDYFAYYCFKN